MKTFIASTAFVASLASVAQALIVNTPASLVQCQPSLLSWGEGTAPFYLSVIPGGQAGAAALKTFPTQTGNSLTWNVDLPVGTSVTIQVRDSTGNVNYASPLTIQAGSDASCLTSSSSSAGGASVPATSTPAASVPSTPTLIISTTKTSTVLPSSTSTPTTSATSGINNNAANTQSPSAPTSSKSNSAGSIAANVAGAVIAMVGAVALLA